MARGLASWLDIGTSGVLSESLGDGNAIGAAFPVGGVVFPPSVDVQGENPVHCGRATAAALFVAPLLKASYLDFVVAWKSPRWMLLLPGAQSTRGDGFCNVKSELLRRDAAWQR